MKKSTYYEDFKVGDPVTIIEHFDEQQPFKCMRIRRICNKTIHIEWVGDGQYYGYINKHSPDKGLLVHEERFNKALKEVITELKED